MDIWISKEKIPYGQASNKGILSESSVNARNIVEIDEVEQSYRLRHEVFAKELGWVPLREDGLEVDAYDDHAEHFGVFSDFQLLSYLRVVRSGQMYMLEKEFSCLVSPDHEIRKDSETCEISRLCVHPYHRGAKVLTDIGLVGPSLFLYRETYWWCREQGVRHLYLVVENRVFRLLKMTGFPCQPVGDAVRMPDGVVAVAALMDWREFEEVNARQRPQFLEWFSRQRSCQGSWPPPLPEHGSPLRVYS